MWMFEMLRSIARRPKGGILRFLCAAPWFSGASRLTRDDNRRGCEPKETCRCTSGATAAYRSKVRACRIIRSRTRGRDPCRLTVQLSVGARHGELKHGAARFVRLDPQPAPMAIDDR